MLGCFKVVLSEVQGNFARQASTESPRALNLRALYSFCSRMLVFIRINNRGVFFRTPVHRYPVWVIQYRFFPGRGVKPQLDQLGQRGINELSNSLRNCVMRQAK